MVILLQTLTFKLVLDTLGKSNNYFLKNSQQIELQPKNTVRLSVEEE